MSGSERVDVLVIGAGQAGLGTAYELGRRAPDLSVLVVDGTPRAGQAWLDRWDSLRLFTPRRFSELPGLRFPAGPTRCPDRVEMAAYLQEYVRAHRIRVRTGSRVERVTRTTEGFLVEAGGWRAAARHVVVATGPFHDRFVPPAATELGPGVRQLHSYDYRSPDDLPEREVVVVGGGNSAAQLALELAEVREVTMVTPRAPWFVPSQVLGVSTYHVMEWFGILQADPDGPVGRYVRRRGDPVFGKELQPLLRDGRVRLRASRVVGAEADRLLLADGSSVRTQAVLWCTGFHSTFPWLEVPGALDAEGAPRSQSGASPVPGLHWMGLPWQSRLDSSIVHGVHADARRTARGIVEALGGVPGPDRAADQGAAVA